MLLSQIRDYIASLEVAEDEHCYSGKLPDKEDKSIGVYHLKQPRNATVTPGGEENKSYGIKSISLLVHWNTDQIQTEKATLALEKRLKECRGYEIGQERIKFIKLYYDEPISVDTDENGIYEYVIECDVYYEKGCEKGIEKDEFAVFCGHWTGNRCDTDL